jgi:mRNA-degrading endonuclease RelE of RelBE toxin-antitoxin system
LLRDADATPAHVRARASAGRPHCGKALKGELQGLWSLRIGRHRIIYRPDDAGADIIAIGPRRTIYEDASRRFARARRVT